MSAGSFRLLLAFLVVIQHTAGIRLGTIAVLLFFFLSGYWITRMWLQEYQRASSPYATYLASRFWRILPLYWVCTAITAVVCWFFNRHAPAEWASLLSPMALTRTVVLLTSAGQTQIMRPAWSLDIEMQFYLAAPFVIAMLQHLGTTRKVIIGCTALVLACPWFSRSWPPNFLQYAGCFMLGVVTHLSGRKPGATLARASLGCFALGLASFTTVHALGEAGWMPRFKPPGGYAVAWPEIAVVLAAIPAAAASVHVVSTPLDRHLGNLAYPLYLIHDALDILFESKLANWPAWQKLLSLPGQWLAMLGAAVLLYLLIDRPSERLRRAFVRGMSLASASPTGFAKEPHRNRPPS